MAPRPKVPFALHPAAKLRQNIEIANGYECALSPDGTVAAVIRAGWSGRSLEFHTLATGAVETALPEVSNAYLESVVWSRDGRRWAVSSLRFEDQTRLGDIRVGERGRDGLRCTATVPHYCAVLRNALARPSPVLAFSPSGDGVVVRVSGGDRSSALMHVSLPDGAVRAQWLSSEESDLYAHAFTDDGTLYTASADPGDASGLAWYAPGAERPTGRLPWVFGFSILPTAKGLWVTGMPRYAFRVAPGPAAPIAPSVPPRSERAEALRARASVKWDQNHLDMLLARVAAGNESYNYRVGPSIWGTGSAPPPTEGMRCLENDLFWETSFAARLGDDDVVISDGVSVWRWRDDGTTLTRDLLADDAQRCTMRSPRIIGLSAAGSTLALLWKKDANGAKTVLSLFDVEG